MPGLSPVAHARTRASTYSFLASALLPPSRERSGNLLKSSRVWSLREAASCLPLPGWLAATEGYAHFLADVRATPRAFLIPQLMAEYCRLFVGPGKLECPPYESVYRDGGCVMGPSTYAVIRICQEAGFEAAGLREPPDHMAYELQFMSRLCSREVELWSVGRFEALAGVLATEDRFQNEHLCRWAPAFCSTLSRTARSPFYAAVASLLDCWVAADAAVPRAWLAMIDCVAAEGLLAEQSRGDDTT